jgi:hypothetical protein
METVAISRHDTLWQLLVNSFPKWSLVDEKGHLPVDLPRVHIVWWPVPLGKMFLLVVIIGLLILVQLHDAGTEAVVILQQHCPTNPR